MIVIVKVPKLGRNYEFKVNEEKSVNTLISEIVEAICKKEMLETPDDMTGFLLASKNGKKILAHYQNLIQEGIHDGETLILI